MGYVAIVNRELEKALTLFTRSRDIYASIGLEKDVRQEDEMIEQVKGLMKGQGGEV